MRVVFKNIDACTLLRNYSDAQKYHTAMTADSTGCGLRNGRESQLREIVPLNSYRVRRFSLPSFTLKRAYIFISEH